MGNSRRFAKHRMVEALQRLSTIDALRASAQGVLQQPALAQPGEPTLVLDEQFQPFYNSLGALRGTATNLLGAINQTLPPEAPLAFSVQLPDATGSIDTFLQEVADLKLMLDEPLARTAGERLSVSGVDRGSILVELQVATQAALVIVGSLCAAALALMAARQKYRKYEHEHELMKLDVKHKTALVEANNAALETISRRLAEGIVAKSGKGTDHEAANFVQLGVKHLSEKFEKGAAVYLSGSAPPDAQKIFPRPGETPLLHEAVLKELLAVNPANETDSSAPPVGDKAES